ncbi:BspA family leucine-rich repeat surface protein [Mycoplasma leachii]|uniref:BspA family leucine-rich repeat surface protein n=1 Tax=Mycoplasma leachii TaxID=2105 RepID=UPI003DA2E127
MLNEQKEKLDSDINTYFQKKKDLEDKRYLLINQVSELKEKIREESKKIKEKEKQLEELSNKYLEKQNQIRDLKEENQRLESSINELNSRYEYLKKKTVKAEYDGNKCIKIGFFYNDKEKYQIEPFKKSTNEVPDHIPAFLKNLSYAFKNNQNQTIKNLEKWNLDFVENIEGIFLESYINMNLNNWKTSNVKNMKKAFYGSSFCCGDISKWDTSEVIDMSEMFSNIRHTIKLDLSTKRTSKTGHHDFDRRQNSYQIKWTAWDVSKVKTMKNMFAGSWFSGSLDTWNVVGIIDEYNFWPHYINLSWFAKWRWPKNTKGRDPYFWENISPIIL